MWMLTNVVNNSQCISLYKYKKKWQGEQKRGNKQWWCRIFSLFLITGEEKENCSLKKRVNSDTIRYYKTHHPSPFLHSSFVSIFPFQKTLLKKKKVHSSLWAEVSKKRIKTLFPSLEILKIKHIVREIDESSTKRDKS